MSPIDLAAEEYKVRHLRTGFGQSREQRRNRSKELEAIVERVQERLVKEHPNLLDTPDDPATAAELRSHIATLLAQEALGLRQLDRDELEQTVFDAVCGYGPLEPLLRDPSVSEIMVVRHDQVHIERNGRLELTDVRFAGDYQVLQIAQRIIAPLGRELNVKTPFVDGRIRNGIRVTATRPPFSKVPTLTIRKPVKMDMTEQQLIELNSATPEMIDFLKKCVRAKVNIMICGPTGSGKTTIARLFCRWIPEHERIITLEETAEMSLADIHPHVVELETRDSEGAAITPAEALKVILHMRPDRIILGEVRGGEAVQLLTAMATGHRGSFSTLHCDSQYDVFDRLVFAMKQGSTLAEDALLKYAVSVVDLIVYIARWKDGSRKISAISEVEGIGAEGKPQLKDIFVFEPHDVTEQRVTGMFRQLVAPGQRITEKFAREGIA